MKDNIKLDRIQVKNLFGRFNYDINLVNGYDVSILIAPNGCGKTTVFNIVNYMFDPSILSFRQIARVPFASCECTLSNGYILVLQRKVTKNKVSSLQKKTVRTNMSGGKLGFVDNDKFIEFSMSIKDGKRRTSIDRFIENQLEAPYYYKDSFDEASSLFDVEDENFAKLPTHVRTRMRRSVTYFSALKEFLYQENCSLSINYIRADRLHNQSYPDNYYSHEIRLPNEEQDPIKLIQVKTSALYKKITNEYNSLQQDMKDRLPKMYLQMDTNPEGMDFDTFKRRWGEYISKIEKYCEIGLLSSKQTILEMNELEEAFTKRKAFLIVYLEAFEKTLKPLEREYKRLKLFVDILNRRNRVTKKVMKYGEEGIVITVGGTKLPIDCLSSGEKNDFVMFYNLVFDSEKNGLVLIDEPEISLHIEWQEEYLDRLLEICEMNGLQAIVATHSPNIVNGHFELYAERGLNDEG